MGEIYRGITGLDTVGQAKFGTSTVSRMYVGTTQVFPQITDPEYVILINNFSGITQFNPVTGYTGNIDYLTTSGTQYSNMTVGASANKLFYTFLQTSPFTQYQIKVRPLTYSPFTTGSISNTLGPANWVWNNGGTNEVSKGLGTIDDNNILYGGGSVYKYTISTDTETKLFDLASGTRVTSNIYYNSSTNRIILVSETI